METEITGNDSLKNGAACGQSVADCSVAVPLCVTPEDEQEIFAAMDEFYVQQEKNRAAIMSEIKEIKGESFVSELEDYLAEEGGNFDFSFVEKHVGELLDEDFEVMSEIYINQTTNGGFTGDTYAGTICVKIEEKKFMLCHYSL